MLLVHLFHIAPVFLKVQLSRGFQFFDIFSGGGFQFLDVASGGGDILFGRKLVFDQRALLVGDYLGLVFRHAGGGEAFDVSVSVEGQVGHGGLG